MARHGKHDGAHAPHVVRGSVGPDIFAILEVAALQIRAAVREQRGEKGDESVYVLSSDVLAVLLWCYCHSKIRRQFQDQWVVSGGWYCAVDVWQCGRIVTFGADAKSINVCEQFQIQTHCGPRRQELVPKADAIATAGNGMCLPICGKRLPPICACCWRWTPRGGSISRCLNHIQLELLKRRTLLQPRKRHMLADMRKRWPPICACC